MAGEALVEGQERDRDPLSRGHGAQEQRMGRLVEDLHHVQALLDAEEVVFRIGFEGASGPECGVVVPVHQGDAVHLFPRDDAGGHGEARLGPGPGVGGQGRHPGRRPFDLLAPGPEPLPEQPLRGRKALLGPRRRAGRDRPEEQRPKRDGGRGQSEPVPLEAANGNHLPGFLMSYLSIFL